MYRAVAWAALDRGVDLGDGAAVAEVARRADIEIGRADEVRIDGADVTEAIRTPEVSRAVSAVAANPEVRRELVERQRRWAADRGGGVVEGRDIGSVVFPDADLKVYLTASPDERARRRGDEPPARWPGGTASTPPGRRRRSSRPKTPTCSTPPGAAWRTSSRRCCRGCEPGRHRRPDPRRGGGRGPGAPGRPGPGGGLRARSPPDPGYRICRAIFRAILWVWFRPRVTGRANVPAEGPVILAPVHRSFADFGFTAFVTDRKLFFMAKDDLWANRWLGWLLVTLGAFPVHRESADREALRRAEEVLRAGQVLVLFPEGTRQEGPDVQQLLEGAAFLAGPHRGAASCRSASATRTGPCQKGQKIPKPLRITVVVGEPLGRPAPRRRAACRGPRCTGTTEALRAAIQVAYDRARS